MPCPACRPRPHRLPAYSEGGGIAAARPGMLGQYAVGLSGGPCGAVAGPSLPRPPLHSIDSRPILVPPGDTAEGDMLPAGRA